MLGVDVRGQVVVDLLGVIQRHLVELKVELLDADVVCRRDLLFQGVPLVTGRFPSVVIVCVRGIAFCLFRIIRITVLILLPLFLVELDVVVQVLQVLLEVPVVGLDLVEVEPRSLIVDGGPLVVVDSLGVVKFHQQVAGGYAVPDLHMDLGHLGVLGDRIAVAAVAGHICREGHGGLNCSGCGGGSGQCRLIGHCSVDAAGQRHQDQRRNDDERDLLLAHLLFRLGRGLRNLRRLCREFFCCLFHRLFTPLYIKVSRSRGRGRCISAVENA